MRKLVLLVTLVALAACAEPGVVDAGPIATAPPSENGPTTTTTTTVSGETTTTTTTTVSEGTTTTVPAQETMGLSVYFMLDEIQDRPHRPGPFLVSVHREVPRTVAVATAAMTELLKGPHAEERAGRPAMSTAIPSDTILLGIRIEDGLAIVDLSREFESGGGSFSMMARLAQVVYTVTQFPTVDRVEFRLDGRQVEVFSGEGLVLDGPVTREDYLDLLPLIFVDRPAWGARVSSPVRVVGKAAVFEATFHAGLYDADGRALAEPPFVMTDEGQGWGDFDFTLSYRVDREQWGHLVVWEASAEDGSRINIREYPLLLTP